MIALVTNLESTDTYPSNGRHCLGIHKGLAGKEAMKIKKKMREMALDAARGMLEWKFCH